MKKINMNRKIINSENYWDNRFAKDWEINEGSQQTSFFCDIFLSNIPQFLKKEFEKGGTFIDVGCAFGECCDMVKKRYSQLEVFGCDISSVAIEKAKNKFKNIKFFKKGIDDLEEKFDFVFCSNVLEHFSDYETKIKSLLRITKKHLIILVPFEEKGLIKEHKVSFDLRKFYLAVDSFYISFFKIFDLSLLKKTYWNQKQILIIYSNLSALYKINLLSYNYIKNHLNVFKNIKLIEEELRSEKKLNKKLIYELNIKEYELKIIKEELEKIKKGKIWRILMIYFFTRDWLLKLIFNFLTDIKFFLFMVIFFIKLNIFRKRSYFIFSPSVPFDIILRQRVHYFAQSISFKYETFYFQIKDVFNFYKLNKNLNIIEISKDKFKFLLKIIKNSFFFLISSNDFIDCYDIFLLKKNKNFIIYDYLDKISVDIFGKNTSFLKRRHIFIKNNPEVIDLVLCVSNKLFKEMRKNFDHQKNIYLPNGVNFCDFNVRKYDCFKVISSDYKKIIFSRKPIIGYYGAIAPWLDFNMINKTAEILSDYNFVFIGQDYDGHSVNKLNKSLSNLFYLGYIKYEKIPCYGIFFDVAIIPFKKGIIAKTTSPLKLFEYFSLGKQVVVTKDLLECYHYNGVYVANNTPLDFSKKIIEAYRKRNKRVESKLKSIGKKNDWIDRVNKLFSKLKLDI